MDFKKSMDINDNNSADKTTAEPSAIIHENRKTDREKVVELLNSLKPSAEVPTENPLSDNETLNPVSDTKEALHKISRNIKDYNISRAFLSMHPEHVLSDKELTEFIFYECKNGAPFMENAELIKQCKEKFHKMEEEFCQAIPELIPPENDNCLEENSSIDITPETVTANVEQMLEEISETESHLEHTDQDAAPPVLDAKVNIFTFADYMLAYMSITPPFGGGKEVTAEDISNELAISQIKTDLDNNFIQHIAKAKGYLHFYKIAEGKFPIHGEDGAVNPLFDPTDKISLKQDEKGKVDYKDLGKFHSIEENQLLCEITPETKGIDGYNVKGNKIPSKNGKRPHIPKGQGTYISDNGLELRSKTDGFLTYTRGIMTVKKKMFIKGDIDVSTGNIFFNGDLEVKGDVNPGFVINVTGNVKIHGVVESAQIISKGNVSIKQGVKGDGVAEIYADGVVKSRFFENCKTIQAKGGIYAESIIHSNIYSDDVVDVNLGKGAVIGGVINAKTSFIAKIIGSEGNAITHVNIGQSFATRKRLEQLTKIIQIHKDEFDNLCKNIAYFDQLPEIPKEKLLKYNIWKKEVIIAKKRLMDNLNEYSKISADEPDLSQCVFKVDKLHPIVNLKIGSDVLLFRQQESGAYYKYDVERREIYLAAR